MENCLSNLENFKRIGLVILLFTIFACGKVQGATFNSKVTASTSDDNRGLVCAKFATTKYSAIGAIFGGSAYTHTAPSAPKNNDEYLSVSVASYEGHTGGNTACEVKVYLYAQPKEGYVFDHWEINNNEKTDFSTSEQNYNFLWVHYTKAPSAGTTTAIAYFRPESNVTPKTNLPVGLVSLDKEKPQIGDEVTATFTMNRIAQSGTIGNKNMMVEFVNWTDENGTILSEEETCKFKVEREMEIIANFRTLGEVPQPGKYYRVRNVYNRVMAVAGSYSVNITSATDISTTLLRWVLPDNHDYEEFWTGPKNDEWILADEVEPLCVEAAPSTIFYIKDGKISNGQLTQAELVGQNVNTKVITGNLLSTSSVDDQYYGYYGITASSFSGAGLQWQVREEGPVFNISTFKSSNNNCAFAIQPIDEEHIDYFWFGADADEDMEFEDGYWTTMYAGFPYKIYDKGVEAYYITTDRQTVNDITYFNLVKIEDGIIPANEAVLLKCSVPNDTKSNRLLPLNPSDVSKTTLEGNILKGSFQLYTDKNKNGRVTFNPENMRVLGLNNDGIVGFYKLTESTELSANKAYLDLSQIPAEARSVALRITSKDFVTGVETIEDGKGGYERDIIYDLMGNRVINPQPGTIYIVNGKKMLWR